MQVPSCDYLSSIFLPPLHCDWLKVSHNPSIFWTEFSQYDYWEKCYLWGRPYSRQLSYKYLPICSGSPWVNTILIQVFRTDWDFEIRCDKWKECWCHDPRHHLWWCHLMKSVDKPEWWCRFQTTALFFQIFFGTELSQKLSHDDFWAKKMLARISISLQAFDFIT